MGPWHAAAAAMPPVAINIELLQGCWHGGDDIESRLGLAQSQGHTPLLLLSCFVLAKFDTYLHTAVQQE